MQQNVRLFHQRAVRIALHSLGIARSSRHAPSFLPIHVHPCVRLQRRCFAQVHPKRASPSADDLGYLGSHEFQVELPDSNSRHDKAAWIAALDKCLPRHLRQRSSTISTTFRTDEPTTSRDVCFVLEQAHLAASFNVLGHLGRVQGRWDAVMWIVNMVAGSGFPQDTLIYPHLGKSHMENPDNLPLESLLQRPVITVAPSDSKPIPSSLEQITWLADPRFHHKKLQRRALGQIWFTLGELAIASAENEEDARELMPHVLTILATLHHHDIVPQSVYRYESPKDDWSVYQPPLLHALADDVVSALIEAAWTAQEANRSPAQTHSVSPVSFLGFKAPQVPKPQTLRPEVWLELILWSCLHGPWIDDGARLLQRLSSKNGLAKWSLICWKGLATKTSAQTISFGWKDALNMLQGIPLAMAPQVAVEKLPVARTVSSELVCAYVDGLLSRVRVGVGRRGTALQEVLTVIKSLKAMLGRQNLGLGFATWDAVVLRFFESGGVWVEQDPAVAMDILQLAEPYGRELEATNVPYVPSRTATIDPYFFGANTLVLGLLHRCLYVQCQRGSVEGAVKTLRALQDFTELNQRRSIEQFFRDLKHSTAHPTKGFRFNNNLAAAEYPAFFMQVPIYVLEGLLDIATNVSDGQFQDWILHSNDVNGPLVPESMYAEPGLAPVLVRFATATNNKTLLEKVMTRYSRLNEKNRAVVPSNITSALMHTLIERRRWTSIGGVMGSGKPGTGYNTWDASVFPVLIAEILKLEAENQAGPAKSAALDSATAVFEALAQAYLGTEQHQIEPDTLFTQLALLASIDERWAQYCSRLLILPRRSIRLKLYPRSFTVVLQAVLESRGFAAGRKFWETWCFASPQLRDAFGAGGLVRVPRKRQPLHENFTGPEDRVVVEFPRTRPLDVVPRVQPTLSDVRLLSKALQQMDSKAINEGPKQSGRQARSDEARSWVAGYIQVLALSKDVREMSLLQLIDTMEESGKV